MTADQEKPKAELSEQESGKATVAKMDALKETAPPPMPVQKLAYNVEEAAQALGVSIVTIYRLIARGKLKCCGALRHKIIPVTELQRFLKDSLK